MIKDLVICEDTIIDVPTELTPEEAARRKLLEGVIRRNLQAFHELGRALREIAEKRLYRSDYGTMSDYTLDKLDMRKSQVYRLIEASRVVDILSPIGETMPSNEAQVRPLQRLSTSDEIIEAWKAVCKLSRETGIKITAALVKGVVDRILREAEPEPDEPGEPDPGQDTEPEAKADPNPGDTLCSEESADIYPANGFEWSWPPDFENEFPLFSHPVKIPGYDKKGGIRIRVNVDRECLEWLSEGNHDQNAVDSAILDALIYLSQQDFKEQIDDAVTAILNRREV